MRYIWYAMYGFVVTLALYALFFRPARVEVAEQPRPADPAPVVTDEAPAGDVQIALLLDTSSSMDGLVAQARAQIWEMVSDMQVTDKGDGKTVAVALYQYGNNRLSARSGFIQQLAPLTPDLDLVTVKLHALSTSGGKEYAPLAIHRAIQELAWNDDDSTEKFIVIAGNENFNQGDMAIQEAMDEAKSHGIRVLPIYCTNVGATRSAVASWRKAAELAGTDFQSIDPDQKIADIESPYDREIMERYQRLEQTRVYAPGHSRPSYAKESVGCLSPSVVVDRAVVNSRQAPTLDVVAEYKKSGRINTAALPAALQSQSKDAQVNYLQEQAETRSRLQAEIDDLSAKRREHLAKQSKGSHLDLGTAFAKSARH